MKLMAQADLLVQSWEADPQLSRLIEYLDVVKPTEILLTEINLSMTLEYSRAI